MCSVFSPITTGTLSPNDVLGTKVAATCLPPILTVNVAGLLEDPIKKIDKLVVESLSLGLRICKVNAGAGEVVFEACGVEFALVAVFLVVVVVLDPDCEGVGVGGAFADTVMTSPAFAPHGLTTFAWS